ncbi:MAG: NAD(P)/FAD-dependent oxidoreductase [Woeseiaceae bacterium]|nr:NAD(P)/FAD-dependent oxidoreductase [Woeseiaceae bacterium]
MASHYDVVVLGGGAAGLFCAATAGLRGRHVLVLEGSNKPGKKILMSGGGRCNFTNLNTDPSHFLSDNPHFCKSALSRYSPYDFLELVEKHDIPYVEKAAGQLFCERSSRDILNMLLAECEDGGVELILQAGVETVAPVADAPEAQWSVTSAVGEFRCTSLVVATGGLSIPKMGASPFGYELARQFGIVVRPTRAALVPFTFTGAFHEMTQRLSGVSASANIACGGTAFTDDVLFTHRGISGPAALQISSFWQPGDELSLSLLPATSIEEELKQAKRQQPKVTVRTVLSTLLPRALVTELQTLFWPDDTETPLNELPDARLRDIAGNLSNWSVKPAATEGYRTAEVTLGGVDTDALSSSTLECRDFPGLYFIGEVIDVTGQLGGFNFQWAWASGHAAGNVA